MPWFGLNFPFPDTIKKKVCRYLLQRYLGQFLEEKLQLEQLNVDFYNGKGNVENVSLSCEALNDICETQGWDVEVTGGCIGSVTVNVPWTAPMTEDSYIEVGQLNISLKPLARQKDDSTSMLESMWSSMSSSMQLAQECLEKEGDVPLVQSNTIEGLERFAQLIDNVLNRIKAKFVDTTLRLEYVAPDSDNGVAIIVKIERVEYENEACGDPPDKSGESLDQSQNFSMDRDSEHNSFLLSAYTSHHLKLSGITFYTEEYRIYDPQKHCATTRGATTSESLITSDQFLSTISNLPGSCMEQSYYDDGSGTDNESETQQVDIEIIASEPILFATLSSEQEIRIKMKQAENLPGPKVELEITLGAITAFLTPRQLQLITYLTNVMLYMTPPPTSPPQQQSQSTETLKDAVRNFRDNKIDPEFFQQKFSAMSNVIGLNQGGWSGGGLDTLDEQLYQASEAGTTVYDEGISESGMSSNSSMISSTMSSSCATSQSSRSRRRVIDMDANADISHFKLRVACVAVVLLHDDILIECAPGGGREPPVSNASVDKLKSKAEHFFDVVQAVTGVAIGANDISKISKSIENALEFHNLRLILTPIIVEGEEQRNMCGTLMKFTISVARADAREHLNDESSPLLEFKRDNKPGGLPSRPEIHVTYKQTRAIIKTSSGRKLAPPRTELNVALAPCLSEFDISILDRISVVLYQEPFSLDHLNIETPQPSTVPTTKSKRAESRTEIKIDCSNFELKIRFPKVDLRPIHDPQRGPWWSRKVHREFLQIHAQQLNVVYTLPSTLAIAANQFDVYLYESDTSQRIELVRTSLRELPPVRHSSGSSNAAVEYPKITLSFPSDRSLQETQERMDAANGEDSNDSDPNSGESIKFAQLRRDPTPFSSKRVLRESETRHTKEPTNDPESFVIPGDNTEMGEFCDQTFALSRLQIQVDLPIVSLQLGSKYVYEVIYNRLNSDLLMWTPSAPAATAANAAQTLRTSMIATRKAVESSLMNAGMMDSIYAPFAMCKSKINIESSTSNSESENSDSDNIFHSAYDSKVKPKKQQRLFIDRSCTSSFKLNIHQGLVTLYAPVRDSNNHLMPGQLGEFVIRANSAYLFTVAGYRNNSNLSYICFNAKSVEIYHCGLTPVPSPNPPLRIIGSHLPEHLRSTVYLMPKNLTQQSLKGSPNRGMVSLAVQVKKCPEQSIRRVRVTAGFQLTTLRHHMTPSQHIWLTQLMDMFDVSDYSIPGYKPTSTITEMHLHLWDCSVDYRPLYLPFRAVATLGTFMISSNITSSSAGCTLRFIAEDCTLSLAPHETKKDSDCGASTASASSSMPRKKSKSNEDTKITVLPAEDLVCVVELGLFEISLRLSEKVTASFPKFDLRAAINDVHIRTCSDSGQALARLIGYLAAEGDLEPIMDSDNKDDEHRMSTTSLKINEDELLTTKQQTVPEEQQQMVNNLLNDAMEECPHVPQASNLTDEDDTTDVFFFPDELPEDRRNRFSMSDAESATIMTSRGSDGVKRRFASDDSISVDDMVTGSYNDKPRSRSYDSDSVNTEMRELLDFETSVMVGLKEETENEVIDPLPQVKSDLGDVTKVGIEAGGARPGATATLKSKGSSDTDDDFCIISEEERPAYPFDDVQFPDGPICIVDNHFSLPSGKLDLLKAPPEFPMAVTRYTLCEMSVTWHIYGGQDFPDEHDSDTRTREDQFESTLSPTMAFSNTNMSEAYKMGVSYSKGSPTLQLGQNPLSKLTWRTRGGTGRKHDVQMEIQLNKVRFSHEIYPNNTEQASRQVLIVQELEIRDRLAASKINKFLYHPQIGIKPKGNYNMIVIKAIHLRPNPVLPAQECCLRISMLPLRLNIDQDSLLFMVNFFSELSGGSGDGTDPSPPEPKQQQAVVHQPPVMMVELPEAAQELQARKMVNENLMLLIDEDESKEKCDEDDDTTSELEQNAPIYFRSIVFSPEVPIRFDYQGKRVELSHGPIAGLLMGLGQLQCSQIVLKRISYRHGILGIDKLIRFLIQEWLQDIKKRQLPKILGGVGPMYSFIQLFQGIFDLFWLPIEQYQKDGRIVRGLQRGAQSFTARTALAALEITTRIIHLLQITAETAYDMLSPGPSVRRSRRGKRGEKKRRVHPPQDIREGVANACQIIREGINDTAYQIVEMAALEHDQKGAVGAVGAVLRQIPPTAVRPLVLATQATSNVLGGVKNQLIPDARIEAKEKWKDEED